MGAAAHAVDAVAHAALTVSGGAGGNDETAYELVPLEEELGSSS